MAGVSIYDYVRRQIIHGRITKLCPITCVPTLNTEASDLVYSELRLSQLEIDNICSTHRIKTQFKMPILSQSNVV